MKTSAQSTIRLSMALTLVASLVFVFGACLPKEPVSGVDEALKDEERKEVLAVMASLKEVPMIHKTNGEIIPSNSIKILAPVDGLVAAVMVTEGQKIRAGTTVIRFSDKLIKAKLELVTAEAEEAEVAVEYEQYRFDNRDVLLEDEEISQAVYDFIERKLEYEKARANRARAEATYLQKASRNLDVVSSIAGIVTNLSVSNQMQVVEGQVLMEIVQDDPVKLMVLLPEEFIPAVYRGQLLKVNFADVPEEQTVKISEVGVTVDPLTKTFDVYAKIDNSEGKLKAGMEIPVTLVTDKKSKIISIPKTAVAIRKRRTVVFRIDDGIVKRVFVRLGQKLDDEVAVQQGLDEGDIVVLDPPKTLKDGDKVEIMTAAARVTE